MEPMIDYRLTEIQVVQARFHALRLLAYTSTVFPGRWSTRWNAMLVPDLIEFAGRFMRTGLS